MNAAPASSTTEHHFLKGIETMEEKRIIGDIAGKIARSENVSNQLEVESNTPVSTSRSSN